LYSRQIIIPPRKTKTHATLLGHATPSGPPGSGYLYQLLCLFPVLFALPIWAIPKALAMSYLCSLCSSHVFLSRIVHILCFLSIVQHLSNFILLLRTFKFNFKVTHCTKLRQRNALSDTTQFKAHQWTEDNVIKYLKVKSASWDSCLSHKIEESMYKILVTLTCFCGFTDMLTAALTDTLTEQPHLLSVAREGLLDGSSGSHLLHQLLMLNPAISSGDLVRNT